MRRIPLWLPFAALGLAAGTLSSVIYLAAFASRWHSAPVEVVFVALLPLAMHWLGLYLESRLMRFSRETIFVLTLALLELTGGTIGALCGGQGLGLLIAGYSAIPIAFAAVAVTDAARRVTARDATPAGRAQERAIWRLTAGVTSLTALAWPPLAGVAFALALLIFVGDRWDLTQLRRTLAKLPHTEPRAPTRAAVVDTRAKTIDLGEGDDLADEIVPGALFRDRDRIVATVHGNAAAALRVVEGALRRDLIAVAFCGGILAFTASYYWT
jgi:hypothetical protein